MLKVTLKNIMFTDAEIMNEGKPSLESGSKSDKGKL